MLKKLLYISVISVFATGIISE